MNKLMMAVILFSACSTKQADMSGKSAKEISDADIAMSDIALKEGFFRALLMFAEDSVIMPREGKLPIIGKPAAVTEWGDKPGTKDITWWPYRAEASSSGDMGYTFGFWQYKTKDTTTYGNYCTVWHKQKDGSWKFVFDGGNYMPGPFTKQN